MASSSSQLSPMLPPSAHLPSIKHIATHPIGVLEDALQYLRRIYSPPVRGTRRRRTGTTPNGHVHRDEEQLAADELRTDAFERAYAIKWLTSLIATLGEDHTDDDDGDLPATSSEVSRRAQLVEHAAALLAVCAGTAAAGVLTRTLAFPTPRGAPPVRVALTDAPLDNQDYGSVGAQTWGGACVLSELIVERPEAFDLGTGTDAPPLRLLELGAGTGLVSLVLAHLAAASDQRRTVHILATDYYPTVLANLTRNIAANFPAAAADPRLEIKTAPLDWSTFSTVEVHQAEFQTPFDAVFGADIVYEAQHAAWIKNCLATLLRKPIGAPHDDPTFHLLIPLRATHAAESGTIEQVFALQREADRAADLELELVIKGKQTILCDTDAEGEEVEYSYYKIGWGAK